MKHDAGINKLQLYFKGEDPGQSNSYGCISLPD